MNRKKILIIGVTTLFGILVWISVAMKEQYVTTVAVPLQIENLPEGRAIRSQLPKVIQVRFKGDGWQLAALLFGPQLSMNYAPTGRRQGMVTVNDIADHLPLRPGIEVIDAQPDSIPIVFERSASRRVPVSIDAVVNFRDGYGQTGSVALTPDSVTVTGAESVVRDIARWPTAHVTFDNVKTPIETDVALANDSPYLLELSARQVHMKIDVEPVAEKILNGLPVNVQNAPAEREVILIPAKIDLVLRGGIKTLSMLTNENFRATVDYRAIVADSTGQVDVAVQSPEGVQIVSKKPDHLQYVVRQRL